MRVLRILMLLVVMGTQAGLFATPSLCEDEGGCCCLPGCNASIPYSCCMDRAPAMVSTESVSPLLHAPVRCFAESERTPASMHISGILHVPKA